MVYESIEEALSNNPGAMSASEIVNLLKEKHGYILHPTNVGQDAVVLKAPFVKHKPFNQQGKPSKIYLVAGIELIIDSLIRKCKKREAYGQVVKG